MAEDHPRTQERILVGFWPEQLAALDELARLMLPGVENPPRAHAIRTAIHEALERRKQTPKKSRKGA